MRSRLMQYCSGPPMQNHSGVDSCNCSGHGRIWIDRCMRNAQLQPAYASRYGKTRLPVRLVTHGDEFVGRYFNEDREDVPKGRQRDLLFLKVKLLQRVRDTQDFCWIQGLIHQWGSPLPTRG